MNHGSSTSSVRHVGDLGNINSSSDGTANVKIIDNHITLDVGINNVADRALIVHAGQDDLGLGGDAGSVASGNAGSRASCGLIVVAPICKND